MNTDIILPVNDPLFTTGDKVTGQVLVNALRDQQVQALNILFVGRLTVEVKSKNPRSRKSNVAQKFFFRYHQKLWEGHHIGPGKSAWRFEFTFPDSNHLLPSYAESETSTLSTLACKGSIEYFLEVSVLGLGAPKQGGKHIKLRFLPPRLVALPQHLPQRVLTELISQSSKLVTGRKSSLLNKLKSPATPDPRVHFRIHFVHSTHAIIGQTLHLFVDFAPDVENTTALTLPPVHLRSLKIVLVTTHTWYTSRIAEDLNAIPTNFSRATSILLLDSAGAEKNKTVLLYDKMDLRPYFKPLVLPSYLLPTIEHENLSVTYHLVIQPEFECLGKYFKHDPVTTQNITFLPRTISPAVQVARQPTPPVDSLGWGSFSDEHSCPVCHKDLSPISESHRQAHMNICLTMGTSANVPERPLSVLVVDDYNDFTSPIAEACLNDFRRTNETFAKCVGQVRWAEHEHVDILEHDFSRDELRQLLKWQGITWTRMPPRFWEIERLRIYDYIIYAGQNVADARARLRNAPLPDQKLIRNTVLIDMATLIPPDDWPHDHRDLETAWTRADEAASPEVRLQRQFQVIKDCCLDFAWQYFKLRLPGFKEEGRAYARDEMPAVVPSELPVPMTLPPELPGVREPEELPASPITDLQRQQYSFSHEHCTDEELYARPDSSLDKGMKHMSVQNAGFESMGYMSAPSNVYELP